VTSAGDFSKEGDGEKMSAVWESLSVDVQMVALGHFKLK
jgi:hypothetical protein